mgnify:FL=1
MDHDGSKKRPIMLHRVCFGSVERFIGILIEHYAGKFPVWLAPTQVKVLCVSESPAITRIRLRRSLRTRVSACR